MSSYSALLIGFGIAQTSYYYKLITPTHTHILYKYQIAHNNCIRTNNIHLGYFMLFSTINSVDSTFLYKLLFYTAYSSDYIIHS
jgi:hypothetical protein